MTSRNIYSETKDKDFPTEDTPHGWIQWKGTNVCMDTYCKCGYHGHIDDEFFYYYKCPKCNTGYAVGSNVKLIELTEDQSKYVAAQTHTYGDWFKTDIPDEV